MKFKIKYADQIVGLLSIFAFAALIFIIFLIGSTQKWFVPKHNFYTVIPTASIGEGKSITYKGFEIGKIKNLYLNNDDQVTVNFYISDEYIEKVTEGSIIEIAVSPIGLGSSVVFYPGNSSIPQPENSFIPERSSKEGKELIKTKKVSIVEQTDSINTIISTATSLLGNVDQLVKQLNLALEGSEETPLSTTLAELNRILGNIADITSSAEGLIPRLLEDENSRGAIGEMLSKLNITMSDLNGISTSLEGDMPGISILISQLQTLLNQAQDVMEGLKNNPLIKNGISTKPEKETATPKLREDNF